MSNSDYSVLASGSVGWKYLDFSITIIRALVFGVIPAYLSWTILYSILLHPLRKYPGPFLAKLTRIPYWSASLRGSSAHWLQQLHVRYGPVVRYGPNDLSYTSPQAWKDIYGYQKGRKENAKDLRFYTSPKNGFPSLAILEAEEHTKIRHAMAPAFSDRALKQQESLFHRFANLMVSSIKKSVKEGQNEVDMVKMYNLTTFDIMSQLLYGEALGLLDKSEYNSWVSLIFKSISMVPIVQITEYYPFLKALYNKLETKSIRKIRMTHHQNSSERLERRLAKGSDQPDVWNLVLSEEDGKPLLTVPHMQSNATMLMTAGTETTATLLSGLTYLLLTNPDKLRLLTKEIREGYASSDEIDFDSLARLKYLNACIEEGLRMYPPIPLGFPRVTPEGGNAVMGKLVAPSTTVIVSTMASYRDPANFKDPDTFAPERWMGDTMFRDDKREARQPFSVGPRNCLGMGMAWHEMRLILAKVLYNFDLELCDKSRGWFDQRVFILWEKGPLMCRLKPTAFKTKP